MANTEKTTNLTVCFWHEQRDIIERAANKARDAYGRPLSISDWMRTRLLPIACRELGIPLPKFPEFHKRATGQSGVFRAASMLGISVKDFEKNAARKVAEELLDAITTPTVAPATVSDTMPPPSMVGFSDTGERRR